MAAFTSKATGNWSSGGQTTWTQSGVPALGDSVTIQASTFPAFTSKASGNWGSSGQTTWNEAGVPGLGDNVTINNGHTVTVAANTTAGDGTAAAITISAGGTIAVADTITLTVYGGVDNQGSIDLGDGSSVDFTGTGPVLDVVVTVTVSTTVGDGTPTALVINFGQTLTIANGVTLTIFGAIDNAGTINLGDGSAIDFTDVGPSGAGDMYVEVFVGTIHGSRFTPDPHVGGF